MTNTFQLPGAEKFSSYLEQMLGEGLIAEGPEVIGKSFDMDYAKRWVIKQAGKRIGEYITLSLREGDVDFSLRFEGNIRGYVNTAVVKFNATRRREKEKLPEDMVALIYENGAYVRQSFEEGPCEVVNTPWQRRDEHKEIPFP